MSREQRLAALYAGLDAARPQGAPTWVEPRPVRAATLARVRAQVERK